jgi:hypothetical protein
MFENWNSLGIFTSDNRNITKLDGLIKHYQVDTLATSEQAPATRTPVGLRPEEKMCGRSQHNLI